MSNPAPFFEQVVWQLTKAEWVALVQAHSGVVGTPDDPPGGADDYSPLGLTAYWEFAGELATATHTTCKALLDAHKVLFEANGESYLSPGVTDATRRARLLLGSWLITPNDTPRNTAARAFCYKLPAHPKPAGWIRNPQCFWNSNDAATAVLRIAIETSPGVNTNYTMPGAAATVAQKIMALPAGGKVLQWNFPFYKHTISGGPTVFVFADGTKTGGWPGLWIEDYEAGLESTLGATLDQLIAGGLTQLDWFHTDMEAEITLDKLRDPANYFPHPNYRTKIVVDPGPPEVYYWRDTINNETWWEHFKRLIQTTKASWAAQYHCPDVTNIGTWGLGALDSAEAVQWSECWFHYHREKMRAVRNIVLERFPNCKMREYDDTIKAPRYYGTSSDKKRWGSRVGAGGAVGHATMRNLYASNQPWPTATAFFPGGNSTITTTAWVQFINDSLTLDMTIAGSRLPQCPLNTVYLSYPAFRDPTPNLTMAFAHHLMSAMAADPALFVWWDSANSTAAQDVIQAAIVAAEGYSRGVIGRNLVRPPRDNWNTANPIIKEHLCSGYVVTMNYWPDGSITTSERVNVINHPPVMDQPSDATATEGVAFSKQITATDPDHNGLTYSIVDGPGWMSINPATGLITGTPTAAGDFTVTVRVVDDDTTNGVEQDEKSFALHVNGATPNSAPSINPIGPQSIAEGSLLSLTATAEDPDDHNVEWTLESGPSGAAITTGGAFTWTPTEAQGPGVYTVTIMATDDGTPPQSSTASFQVTVTEVNVAPTLASISNQTINEGDTLSLSASGSDADLPAQTLVYSLDTAPAGMTINSSSGAILWPTNETHGSVTPYPVTVRVSDGTLSATRSFTVTVNEVNTAPVITPAIGNRDAAQGVLISFQCEAVDVDVPAQTLNWSLGGTPPSGASVTSGGLFTWTPGSSGDFSIQFIVSDGSLTDSETITISVSAANTPPVLAAIGDKLVIQGNVLTFTATATDADAGQTITYSLDDQPTGASIGASSGVFTWQPAANQLGEHTFTVIATDSGSPAFSDSETITVTVAAPATNDLTIAPIPTQNVVEGEALTFTLVGSDPIGSLIPFTYDVIDPPDGLEIDGATGVVRWTPSKRQSGSVYLLSCQAYKGSPGDRVTILTVPVVVHRNFRVRSGKQSRAYTQYLDGQG